MRNLTLVAGLLALIGLPLLADSRWGSGGCDAPAQTPPVGGIVYRWEILPSDKNMAYLFANGKQIGAWSADAQTYWPSVGGVWGGPQTPPASPPNHLIHAPAESKPGKLEPFQLGGVIVDEMCKHERHSIGGKAVAEADGVSAITRGLLPDDSSKLWLSIWSRDPAKRNAVVHDLKADANLWKWVTERCHLWAGDAANPDHFLARDRDGQSLYAFDGDPLIMLQDPNGVELWHDAGYTQGPVSFDSMRKRDPAYTPDKTPGPVSPKKKDAKDAPGHDAAVPLMVLAAAGGLVLYSRRKKSP